MGGLPRRLMVDEPTIRVPGNGVFVTLDERLLETLHRFLDDGNQPGRVYEIVNRDVDVKTTLLIFAIAEDQSLASFIPLDPTAKLHRDLSYLADYFCFHELVAALEKPRPDHLAGGDSALFSSDDASATVSERITAALRFTEVMNSLVRYFPSLQSDSTGNVAEAWDEIEATVRDCSDGAWEIVAELMIAHCEKLSLPVTPAESLRSFHLLPQPQSL
jgi:hypothetical protein